MSLILLAPGIASTTCFQLAVLPIQSISRDSLMNMALEHTHCTPGKSANTEPRAALAHAILKILLSFAKLLRWHVVPVQLELFVQAAVQFVEAGEASHSNLCSHHNINLCCCNALPYIIQLWAMCMWLLWDHLMQTLGDQHIGLWKWKRECFSCCAALWTLALCKL